MTMKIINDTNDTSDKSDTSDTANSSDASKTSGSVTRLSSYLSLSAYEKMWKGGGTKK